MSFLGQDVVNHAVFQRLAGGHPVVAVHVSEDLFERLSGALGDDLTKLGTCLLNLLCCNEDIRRLPFGPAKRLVNQDPGVGEGGAFAFLAGTKQYCAHRGSHTSTDGPDRWCNQLHGVIDGESGTHLAAGGIQIEGDVCLSVQRCQEEQLCLDDVRDIVIDGNA